MDRRSLIIHDRGSRHSRERPGLARSGNSQC
jgi:hypothetical protein